MMIQKSAPKKEIENRRRKWDKLCERENISLKFMFVQVMMILDKYKHRQKVENENLNQRN